MINIFLQTDLPELLRDEDCGGRPPVLWENDGHWLSFHGQRLDSDTLKPLYEGRMALALMYRGVVQEIGVLRALQALAFKDDRNPSLGVGFAPEGEGWILSTPFSHPYTGRIYSPHRDGNTHVPTLGSYPSFSPAALRMWALATICEARGLGARFFSKQSF